MTEFKPAILVFAGIPLLIALSGCAPPEIGAFVIEPVRPEGPRADALLVLSEPADEGPVFVYLDAVDGPATALGLDAENHFNGMIEVGNSSIGFELPVRRSLFEEQPVTVRARIREIPDGEVVDERTFVATVAKGSLPAEFLTGLIISPPTIESFVINDDEFETGASEVVLKWTYTREATHYRVDTAPDLSGAAWQENPDAGLEGVPFDLGENLGRKTVYLQLMRSESEGEVLSGVAGDSIDHVDLLVTGDENGVVTTTTRRLFRVSGVDLGLLTRDFGLHHTNYHCAPSQAITTAVPPSHVCPSTSATVYFFVTDPTTRGNTNLGPAICKSLAPGWTVNRIEYAGDNFIVEQEGFRTQLDVLCVRASILMRPAGFPFISLGDQGGSVTITAVTLVGPVDAVDPAEAFQE